MKKMTEISRRSLYHEDEGLACGPVASVAVMTEIVVDVDGRRVFLHGEWVDIAGDNCYFEADTESLFDAYVKLFDAETEDAEENAIAERDRISEGKIEDDSVFEPYYAEMERMIRDEMKAHGIECDCEDEEDDE